MATTFKLKWNWKTYPAKQPPWIKLTATAKGDTAETLLVNWQKTDSAPQGATGVTVTGKFADGQPTAANLTVTIDDKFKAGATFHKWLLPASKATDAASADKFLAADQAKPEAQRDPSLKKLETTVDGAPSGTVMIPDDDGKDVPFNLKGAAVVAYVRQTVTGASLSEDDFRAKAVRYMEQINGLGASGSADRTAAYADFLGLWKNDVEGPAWTAHNQGSSSCGITVRSLWRLLGLRAKGTTSFDAPYTSNQIFTALQKIAESKSAFHDMAKEPKDGSTFLPKPGDVIFIMNDQNQHEHVFTCVQAATDPSAATFDLGSIDGGQTHLTAQPVAPIKGFPTPSSNPQGMSLADQPCQGIWRRKRTFTRKGLKINSAPQGGASPNNPASLDAGKHITGWIELGKMQSLFTCVMIEPQRKSLTELQTPAS